MIYTDTYSYIHEINSPVMVTVEFPTSVHVQVFTGHDIYVHENTCMHLTSSLICIGWFIHCMTISLRTGSTLQYT